MPVSIDSSSVPMAYAEPFAQHEDRREVLLDSGDRPGVGPDMGGAVERRELPQSEPSRRAATDECPRRPARPPPRPYAARVLAFAIRLAKNSRNRAVAWGPASTITCGRTLPFPARRDRRLRGRSGRLGDCALALFYGCRLRRAEAVAVDDLDLENGYVTEPGPLLCRVLQTGMRAQPDGGMTPWRATPPCSAARAKPASRPSRRTTSGETP